MWATIKKYNINANLFRVIKQFYDKAASAVLFNGSVGDWFRTKVEVRQGCLNSPTLFNTFLERSMKDAIKKITKALSALETEQSSPLY